MVAKKSVKKEKKKEKSEDEGGVSLDDAFGDDEAEGAAEKMKGVVSREPLKVKGSKPISKVKKGDTMKIDGVDVEVDAHYVLIDHGSTKEMVIEVFDKNDHDYQIRYFDDQVESTMEVYEL